MKVNADGVIFRDRPLIKSLAILVIDPSSNIARKTTEFMSLHRCKSGALDYPSDGDSLRPLSTSAVVVQTFLLPRHLDWGLIHAH